MLIGFIIELLVVILAVKGATVYIKKYFADQRELRRLREQVELDSKGTRHVTIHR